MQRANLRGCKGGLEVDLEGGNGLLKRFQFIMFKTMIILVG